MTAPEATSGSVFMLTVLGVASQLDGEAYATILIAIALAILSAWLTYRVAIRQVKSEITRAFADHIEQMHADHKEFLQAVNDPAEKE